MAGPIQSVPRRLIILAPRLALVVGLFGFYPLGIIDKPVVDELLLILLGIAEVTFSQASRSDIQLADLANAAQLGMILLRNNEDLDILHTPTRGNSVSERVEGCRIVFGGRDFEVRHGST